jgi:hypothetical protein
MEITLIVCLTLIGGFLAGIVGAYLFRPQTPQINYQHETEKREALKDIAKTLETIAHLQRISMGGKSPKP